MWQFFGVREVLNRRELKEAFSDFTGAEPIIATMPTGRVSATIRCFKQSPRPVVILDRGAVSLWHWTAICYAQLMKKYSVSDEDVVYTYDPDLVTSDFSDLGTRTPINVLAGHLAELAITGTLTQSAVGRFDVFESPLQTERILDDAIVHIGDFILGHEMGHFVCGHVKGGQGHSLVDDYRTNWTQEFEADQFGIALATSRLQMGVQQEGISIFAVMSLLSVVDFFLWSFQALEMLVSRFQYGTDTRLATKTHPSSTRRRVEVARTMVASMHSRSTDKGAGSSEVLERCMSALRSNMDAHATFWSHVIHLATAQLSVRRNDGESFLSPLWKMYDPLPRSTLSCDEAWEIEDVFERS
jgi:hypothetical protein